MKKITLMLFALVVFCWQSNAQFTESFDTEIPATWTVLNEDGGSYTWAHVTSYPQAGAGHARIRWESAAHEDYLITPQFTVTSGTSDRVSFYAGIDGSTFTETFEVKVSTTGTAAADFTDLIGSETATTSAADGNYTFYAYDLSAYDGSDIYVAIVATDTDRYYLSVDEFVNDALPSCLQPTSLSASVTSATEAELSWLESGSASVWDIEIVDVTASETVTGVATATGVSNPYTAMGLTEGNDYEFYVRTDCGVDGFSTWAGPFDWSQNVPPANDECGAAIALTVNEDLNCAAVTEGTTYLATASPQEDDVSGTPNNDVWFSFVAAATKHTVSLSNVTAVSGTSTDMGIGVYDATAGCDALVFTATSDPNTLSLTELTIGTTYLVRVYGWSSSALYTANTTFDICVGTPCLAEAGTLTADEESVVLAGTATISATANGDMFVPTDYEVTYVLTSGATLIIEQVAATPSFIVTAIGDYTIHTLVAETSDVLDPNYLDLSVVDFGVTTGADVIGLVDLGDLCASLDVTGAPISVNDGSEMDFNNVQWVTDGTNGSDVSLTVEVNTPITVYAKGYEAGVTDAEGQGAGVECWIAINDEDTDPSTWDSSMWQVATYGSDNGGDDEYAYTTSTTPVGTHYVAARWRLNNAGFTYGGYNGTWDGTTNLSIELIIDPLANDDCAGAQSVTQETEIADADNATATPGSIAGATDSGLDAEECGIFTGTANDDVWYSFVALTENVNITFELSTGFDGVVELFSGTCGALTVVGCADNGLTEEVNATGLTVGETYYTRVFQYGTGSTAGKTFDLKIWSPDEALSVNNFETEAAFSYYPNPVKNTLTLNAQNTIEQVAMYNMLGQEVLRVTPNTVDSDLDMSHLQTGTYFVKVTIANVTKTIRVIKQ